MLLYYPFWMFMGFILHIYIIFGTNLLTRGPAHIVVFLPISVFRRKGISNGVQTEWNLWSDLFGTNAIQETWSGRQEAAEAATRVQGARLMASLTDFIRLYILAYPESTEEHHETLFTPPQPSVPVRSHLGAFSGALSEGESITKGFYINTIASLRTFISARK